MQYFKKLVAWKITKLISDVLCSVLLKNHPTVHCRPTWEENIMWYFLTFNPVDYNHWRCRQMHWPSDQRRNRHAVFSTLLTSPTWPHYIVAKFPDSFTLPKHDPGFNHLSQDYTRPCQLPACLYCSGTDRSPGGLRNNVTAWEGNLHLALSTLFPLCHPTVLTTTIINLSLCGDAAKLLKFHASAELSTSRVTQLCRYVGGAGTQ